MNFEDKEKKLRQLFILNQELITKLETHKKERFHDHELKLAIKRSLIEQPTYYSSDEELARQLSVCHDLNDTKISNNTSSSSKSPLNSHHDYDLDLGIKNSLIEQSTSYSSDDELPKILFLSRFNDKNKSSSSSSTSISSVSKINNPRRPSSTSALNRKSHIYNDDEEIEELIAKSKSLADQEDPIIKKINNNGRKIWIDRLEEKSKEKQKELLPGTFKRRNNKFKI